MTDDTLTTENIRDRAIDAFWAVVASKFPSAESGDLDPLVDAQFESLVGDIIRNWAWLNLPFIPAGTRVVFTRTVERFPDHRVSEGEMGTVVAHNPSALSVRLDNPPDGIDEWDSYVMWYSAEAGFSEYWDDIKAVSSFR